MKRQMILLILTAILIMGLTACGEKASGSAEQEKNDFITKGQRRHAKNDSGSFDDSSSAWTYDIFWEKKPMNGTENGSLWCICLCS